MCQVGDIIVIQKCKDRGNILSRHSFVVIDDEEGRIEGISYDFIANVMSSFKTDDQRKRKLNYLGNFPIVFDDRIIENDNGLDGYIKTYQLYYFQKSNIEYQVIGSLKPDIFNLIIEFINESDFPIEDIIDNLVQS